MRKYYNLPTNTFDSKAYKKLRELENSSSKIVIYFSLLFRAYEKGNRSEFIISKGIVIDDEKMSAVLGYGLKEYVDFRIDFEKLGLIRIINDKLYIKDIFRGNQRDRGSKEYKEWRDSVFKRDNYECQNCFKGGKLNAHHIKHWATHIDLRFELNNGLTLCEECHEEIHKKQI